MDDGPVLIVGQRPDPHIEAVAEELRALDRRPLLFDRWAPDQGITLEYSGHGKAGGCLHTADGDVDLADIESVWWRVKPVRPVDFGFHEGSVEQAFAGREWREVLRSLSELLSGVPWINVLAHQVRAARKPWQLALAGEVGLPYPETIITNRSDSVLEGFEPDIGLVYKTLSSFVRPPDEIVFTNEVTRDQIQGSWAEIALAPGIFQRRLPKRYEVRVTVVGEHLFSAGIDSQSDAATRVDWRRNQGREMYFETELSPAVQEKLLAFHRSAGLVFATYDFIVSPDGEEFFLECNPGGQWLWLEQALGLEISGCLAAVIGGGP